MRVFWAGLVLLLMSSPVLAQTVGHPPPCTALGGSSAASQAVACYNLGVALEHADRHDQAIADFAQAIALKPDFTDAYESRGVAYDQKGLYDRAIADYTHALSDGGAGIPPADRAQTYFNRGAAYEHRRLYQKAIEDYRAALALDPSLEPPKTGLKRLGAAM